MQEDYVQGLNERREEAWRAFYEDFYSSLCAYARRYVGSAEEAEDVEDVVQETCVKVWESKRRFTNREELTWYMYKAVYTNAMWTLRKRRLHERLLENVDREEAEFPEEAFEASVREELIRRMHQYIKELPAGERRILELTLEGFSGPEIAEKLGITIYTVKSQKNHSFKTLRERFAKSGYVPVICMLLAHFL